MSGSRCGCARIRRPADYLAAGREAYHADDAPHSTVPTEKRGNLARGRLARVPVDRRRGPARGLCDDRRRLRLDTRHRVDGFRPIDGIGVACHRGHHRRSRRARHPPRAAPHQPWPSAPGQARPRRVPPFGDRHRDWPAAGVGKPMSRSSSSRSAWRWRQPRSERSGCGRDDPTLRGSRRTLASLPGAIWCGREDSNLHALRRQPLKLVRLPIPPRPHVMGAGPGPGSGHGPGPGARTSSKTGRREQAAATPDRRRLVRRRPMSARLRGNSKG